MSLRLCCMKLLLDMVAQQTHGCNVQCTHWHLHVIAVGIDHDDVHQWPATTWMTDLIHMAVVDIINSHGMFGVMVMLARAATRLAHVAHMLHVAATLYLKGQFIHR